MIKSLQNDVYVTPFVAAKTWNAQNIINDDLILWISGSETGNLSHIYIDYEDGTSAPITNSYCNLALLQQDRLPIVYQRGEHISGTFFQSSSIYYDALREPVNIDKSYMRLIYNTTKHTFYNGYNNPLQMFGLENINSTPNKSLTDSMDVFTIPKQIFGEKIIPTSIEMRDDLSDELYIVVDDGDGNLILSGSHFSEYQEVSL